jgi:DNA-binding CsgD family transcriptional regulator
MEDRGQEPRPQHLSAVQRRGRVLERRCALRTEVVKRRPLMPAELHDAAASDADAVLAASHYVSAVSANGAGRHAEALLAARRASAMRSDHLRDWALAELVEAAVRSGRHDEARAASQAFTQRPRRAGRLGLGLHARSVALVADDDSAESGFLAAIEHFAAGGSRVMWARTGLVYGEWLRRRGRRTEARTQLREAHAVLVEIGAANCAARAHRELLATGESAQPAYGSGLTPQEAEVARLAAAGCTNPEIGEQLYISARTVEYHLRKVFVKLGVRSRRQLRDPALPAAS